MPREAERAVKLRELASRFTNGEVIRGMFAIQKDDSLGPEVPWRRRPRVLKGEERPGSVLRCPIAAFGTLLARGGRWPRLLDSPHLQPWTNERREELRRSSTSKYSGDEHACQQFGPWESLSGTLVRAVQARSRTRFRNFLVATDESLFVLHAQSGLRLKHFANAGEAGWRIERHLLEWTRDTRRKLAANGYQLGFSDGSWMSLHARPVYGYPEFTGIFPRTLPRREPIPPFQITAEEGTS